ncbi:hypothetical protein PG987_004100 [Apiospora arundinis]
MAATRRGQPELHVRLPPRSPAGPTAATWADLPSISALFLIDFDVKAGYTISWKAARPGTVELEGVVEYKSLPSGLHTVTDDLIYFVHDDYAGLSAFVNAPCEDTEARNARMLAVGVLVPLSYGRLGRAWKHAEGLKEMAAQLADDAKQTQLLEQYWEKHQARDSEEQKKNGADDTAKEPADGATSTQTQQKQQVKTSKRAHLRSRSASDGAALLQPEHKLSNFHPAWSLKKLLDTFGPLIFPIHRAALLRKRILISCHAPVQEINNFVYDISILSNIPLSTYDLLSPDCPSHRLRPLFTVGVHDIPFLIDTAKPKTQEELISSPDSESGWIACTTDSILAMKDTLWDMLITMPLPHAAQAQEHVWPTVECPRGNVVKATQRDLRRFRSLKNALSRLEATSSTNGGEDAETPGASPTTSRPPTTPQRPSDDPLVDETDKIVEPQTWTALAYNGFMWWASAGEQTRSNEAEELAHDAGLLADMFSPSLSMSINAPRSADLATTPFQQQQRRLSTTATSAPLPPEEARAELAIISYFHRLTSTILTKLADLVEENGDDDDDDYSDTESNMMDDGIDDEDDEEGDVLLRSSGAGGIGGDGAQEGGGRSVRISIAALRAMGLDIWSASDIEFVREALAVYFGRRAYVEGKGVEVCGVRVC